MTGQFYTFQKKQAKIWLQKFTGSPPLNPTLKMEFSHAWLHLLSKPLCGELFYTTWASATYQSGLLGYKKGQYV